MRLAAALALALAVLWVVRADEVATERAQVIKKCATYLEKKDSGREHDKWISKINSRISDLSSRDDISQSAAADRILTNYLQDIHSEIADNKPEKMKDATRIELCRWVVLYASNDWAFDKNVMDKLTLANFKTWIE
jgi:hypothetical protein